MPAELVQRFTRRLLDQEFGESTVRKARRYAVDGSISAVTITETSPDEVELTAKVEGRGGRRYSVSVSAYSGGRHVGLESLCSCPVGYDCKHGAALALVVMGGSAGSEGALPIAGAMPGHHAHEGRQGLWEQRLGALLADLDGPVPTQHRRLGIQFNLSVPDASRWGATQATLRLRLLHQGAKQNLIRTGIKWSDVPVLGLRRSHTPAQVEVLSRLQAGLGSLSYYSSAVDEPLLSEFGTRGPELLAEAAAAGIEFLPGSNLESMAISAEPTELSADVVTADGSTYVRLALDHDGGRWDRDQWGTVGLPAHAVVLLRGAGARRHAVISRLARPLPASMVTALRAGEPIAVPERERERLVESWLPQLRRHARTESSDGSVRIPEPPKPRLVLTVEWDSSTRAQVSWEWHYGNGDQARRCPIDSQDRVAGLRDRAQEAELLAGLPLPLPAVAHEKVTGLAALELATETLPIWRDCEMVEVVERERPDFRSTDATVEIAFGLEPDDSGSVAGGGVDWLDLTVTIRVEDEQISLAQVLEALTHHHEHLILASGLYLRTDRPEFAALDDLVRAAAELKEQHVDRLSIGTHDLGVWAQLADLGVVDEQATHWVRRAQALRDLVELPSPPMTGIASTPRSYQLEGFRWLAFLWQHGLGGVLADDMGLGKTLQVLALIAHARESGSQPFLVVAPSSVVSAWESESARHAPGLTVRAITSSASRRGTTLPDAVAGADVVVTTYTLFRLESDDYAELGWGGVVLDEAQQVKNHLGKTYRAVRTLEAPFKLAVTGTPFENRLMELWSLLSITAPGLYPSAKLFSQHVAGPVEKQGDEAALRRFRQRIRPFLLRRTKELVAADLPPKQEQVLEVQLGAKHRRIYDTHLQKERQKILGLVENFEANRVAIFSSLTKLRQLALDPGLVDPAHADVGSAKLDLLVEHLREISAEGHRALVFSQFTSFLGLVRERLRAEGLEACYLDGRTRRRGEVIAGFKTGTAPVFLISLKAGGVGLTLTEADYVFVLDPWWNPATEAQAVDRTHRIGQQRPVLVYRLVSGETIEEKVMALKERKAALFSQVVDGEGLMGGAIEAADIRALFASDSGL